MNCKFIWNDFNSFHSRTEKKKKLYRIIIFVWLGMRSPFSKKKNDRGRTIHDWFHEKGSIFFAPLWQINNWKGRLKINYHTLCTMYTSKKEGWREWIAWGRGLGTNRKRQRFSNTSGFAWCRWYWVEQLAFHLNYGISLQYNNRQNKNTYFFRRDCCFFFFCCVHHSPLDCTCLQKKAWMTIKPQWHHKTTIMTAEYCARGNDRSSPMLSKHTQPKKVAWQTTTFSGTRAVKWCIG